MAKPEYRTKAYRAAKRDMRGAPCWMCGKPSDSVDHYPPISSMPPGQWSGTLRPACTDCQNAQGKRLLRERGHGRTTPLPSRLW